MQSVVQSQEIHREGACKTKGQTILDLCTTVAPVVDVKAFKASALAAARKPSATTTLGDATAGAKPGTMKDQGCGAGDAPLEASLEEVQIYWADFSTLATGTNISRADVPQMLGKLLKRPCTLVEEKVRYQPTRLPISC